MVDAFKDKGLFPRNLATIATVRSQKKTSRKSRAFVSVELYVLETMPLGERPGFQNVGESKSFMLLAGDASTTEPIKIVVQIGSLGNYPDLVHGNVVMITGIEICSPSDTRSSVMTYKLGSTCPYSIKKQEKDERNEEMRNFWKNKSFTSLQALEDEGTTTTTVSCSTTTTSTSKGEDKSVLTLS